MPRSQGQRNREGQDAWVEGDERDGERQRHRKMIPSSESLSCSKWLEVVEPQNTCCAGVKEL